RTGNARPTTSRSGTGLWTSAGSPPQAGSVDGEAGAHGLDAGGDLALGGVVAAVIRFGEPVQHLADHHPDLAELVRAEAAAGRGRAAETDPGGYRRLGRIERDGVLVGRDMGALEARFGGLAGHPLGAEVD